VIRSLYQKCFALHQELISLSHALEIQFKYLQICKYMQVVCFVNRFVFFFANRYLSSQSVFKFFDPGYQCRPSQFPLFSEPSQFSVTDVTREIFSKFKRFSFSIVSYIVTFLLQICNYHCYAVVIVEPSWYCYMLRINTCYFCPTLKILLYLNCPEAVFLLYKTYIIQIVSH